MFQKALVSETHVEPLADAVFTVLEKVGVLCQNRELLEAMQNRGARVDFSAQTANIPAQASREFLRELAGEPLPPRRESGAFVSPGLPHLGTQIAQFYYDHAKKERRSGNCKDFIELLKLGSVLHPDVPTGHSLLLTDVPAMLEPLEAALLLAEHAPNPGTAFAWHVDQVDYLVEMGEIVGRPNWFGWGAICFAHPLRFDKDVADKFVRRVKAGVPTGLTAMPVAGVTTPIPLAGFIAVAAAEIFATWFAARALNPAVQIGGSIWGGAMDMKTGEVSYCSFDAMNYAFALSEFLYKWTGRFISVGGGEYCDARKPGYYAALEKAYKSMTIAAFSGHHPPAGEGMLEEGKTLSPVQLLLERELGLGLSFLGRQVDASPENLCMDSILNVGFGLEKNYLNAEETLHGFREHLWCPEKMDRSGWNGAHTDEIVLDRLQNKIHDLLAEYQKPDIDPDKLAAMRNVVERARKNLLN